MSSQKISVFLEKSVQGSCKAILKTAKIVDMGVATHLNLQLVNKRVKMQVFQSILSRTFLFHRIFGGNFL